MNFPRYIQETPRDFFYLTERDILPGAPPVVAAPLTTSGWKSVSAKGNEFPSFVVSCSAEDDKGQSVPFTRLDPKRLRPSGDNVVLGLTGSQEGLAERQLYFKSGTFMISDQPIEGGALLFSGGSEGKQAACLEINGKLTLIGPAKDASQLKDIVQAQACVDVLWLAAPLQLTFNDEAKDAKTKLSLGPADFAPPLYPETPLVPPSVWGIPQSKRATLVTSPP